MPRHAIPQTGVYLDERGRFWARPHQHGRYTWRLLKAKKLKDAVVEASTAAPRGQQFAIVADLYVKGGCPTKRFKFKRGPDDFVKAETWRAGKLKEFFRTTPLAEIELATLIDYHTWRTKGVPTPPPRLRTQDSGLRTSPPAKPVRDLGRAVDKECQTLSNILNYAIFITRQLTFNPIRENRPRFQVRKSSARERMPMDADAIHKVADHFFAKVRSEVFGWLELFSMFTGCRTSELLRLRRNAKQLDSQNFEPGHIANGYLYLGRRSKNGTNPWSIIGPEFAQMLACFGHWHLDRFGHATDWFFPGNDGISRIGSESFSHSLPRAALKLGLPHVTPHGLRAYYATKRLRDGASPALVAAEIGDQTVSLISTTYADHAGGAKLSWLPSTGLPAWLRWQPAAQKIVGI